MPKLFLDLEETVIKEWEKFPTFLNGNCSAIRAMIDRLIKMDGGSFSVTLFSFAVANDADRSTFINTMKRDLEMMIGVNVDHVLTVEEIMQASQKIHHMKFDDLLEFSMLRGKEGAFDDWCTFNKLTGACILIDDTVKNRTINDMDTGLTMFTVNINTLVKQHSENKI